MQAEENRGYRARELVLADLPEDQFISLPVPMRYDDRLVDGFFTFGMSFVHRVPLPVTVCLAVLDNGSVADASDRFDLGGVSFDTSHDVSPVNWVDAFERAYASYDGAFEELEHGEAGPWCADYVRAVRDATLRSQMAYYELLCPELFGDDAAFGEV